MKRILVAILAVAMAGCCNIMMRTDSERNLGPYHATCEVAECVACPFMPRQYGEQGIGQVVCTLLFPIFVVDLPFDAAVDTVMLPWDLWQTHKLQAERDAAQAEAQAEKVEVVK